MSKLVKLPEQIKDKFLLVNGLNNNGVHYFNFDDPSIKEKFLLNNGRYATSKGVTACIIGDNMYVTPIKDVTEVLESYGFKKGFFKVPFSQDIYESYPNALGPSEMAFITAHNINDPLRAIEDVKEKIFKTDSFQKWNELIKERTRNEGKEIDIEKYNRAVYIMCYEGEDNKERRDKYNASLRAYAKDLFKDNKEIIDRFNEYEQNNRVEDIKTR